MQGISDISDDLAKGMIVSIPRFYFKIRTILSFYIVILNYIRYNYTVNFTLIAHEIGHALGFGHVNDSLSVMYQDNPPSALNAYDKACLADKYPLGY